MLTHRYKLVELINEDTIEKYTTENNSNENYKEIANARY